MSLLNDILLFSCAALLTFGGISAEGGNLGVTEAQNKVNELLLEGKLAVWELLDNAVARNAMHEFFGYVRQIMETQTSADIMVGLTRQMKDTLIDKEVGAVSMKYITDGVRELLTHPSSSATLKALLDSVYNVMHSPDTPVWLEKVFNFLDAAVKTHRGADLFSALGEGVIGIIHQEDPKKRIIKAFENLKYHI